MPGECRPLPDRAPPSVVTRATVVSCNGQQRAREDPSQSVRTGIARAPFARGEKNMTIWADVDSAIPNDESSAEHDGVVLQHLKLVKALAARIYRRLPIAVDLNDLFQAGVVGLLDAIKSYD